MSNTKESTVRDSDGKVVGVDVTTYGRDGESRTDHYTAHEGIFGPVTTEKTGETYNHSDGTSTHYKK